MTADRLLESGAMRAVECDVSAAFADAVAVDALARLIVVARRRRARLQLRGVTPSLRELIVLAGLEGVISG